MDRYDVVIVGAGLSGLSCGIHLLLLEPEWKVLIMDRLSSESYPRYHRMCGEALSDAAVEEMKPIKLTGVRHRILFAEEHWPDGTVIKAKARGFIIDRPAFLGSMQEMFQGLGGCILWDRLQSVQESEDGFVLQAREGNISCSWLVGADGAFSRVRSELYSEQPRSMIPVKQFLLRGRMASDDTIVFHYGSRYQGAYRWEFPCGDHTNMGYPKGCQEPYGDVVEENGRYIPIGALKEVVRGRSCLVGDAAGMVNPVSFGGIRVAMLSGKKAALYLSRGSLEGYQSWWDDSQYSRTEFYEAYLEGRGWNDEDMSEFIHPFRKGYGISAFIRAYLRRPGQRRMVMAYLRSFKIGW
ncbi:MAG: NAD(P)/FAD-dependent oxidoreductase [Candidatus Methanomethylophilaceae archaeon]|nr:NAD(P)/FAD-dependent oxidoreductase [Candidatus Methanomethylophilaceae archaeon]